MSEQRDGALHRSRCSAGTLVLCLVLAILTWGPAAAQAQAPPVSQDAAPGARTGDSAEKRATPAVPPEVTAGDLEALAETLQNEAEREKFLATVRALIAARKAEAKEERAQRPRGFTARIAERMSRSVERLGERVAAVVGVLKEAPRLLPWLESWLAEAPKRERLIGLFWRFIVIVGAGMVLQDAFRRATGPWQRRLEAENDPDLGGRIFRFIARTVLLYANAFAYGAGAYGALALLPMRGVAGEVLLVGAGSFFVAKLILATTRMAFAPGTPTLRPMPVSDETATYIYIWVRRLVRIFVYTFFFLYAAWLVGLPEPAYRSLLYLVGFALLVFLVVFVLQNRTAVAEAIQGGGERRAYGSLRGRLAATWHVFAILYLVAVYAVWLFEIEDGFAFLMTATGWTVLALFVAKLLALGAARGTRRLFRVSADLEARFPGLEARANRYLPVLNRGIAWLIYIGAALVILHVWSVDTFGWVTSPQGAEFLQKMVTILFILLVAVVAWEALTLAIGRYLERLDGGGVRAARARTLLPLLRTTALIVIAVLVVLVILSEVGVNIAPLLAGAGVVGLAIGFGAQKLVQDVITGLFILIENTLAVGDIVQFDADHAGIVEAISIRSVRLRDLSGSVHTLPFSEVKTVLNLTKDFAYYLMDIGVAYRENVDNVMRVLREVADEMREDPQYGEFIVEPLEILGLNSFADSAVVIRARLKIVPPINKWSVGREFNRRMKARFDAEGIEIPFPHRTLYFGEDRSGKAPPAHVEVTERGPSSRTEETPDSSPAPAAPGYPPARDDSGDS